MNLTRRLAVTVFLVSLSIPTVALADDVPELRKTPGVVNSRLTEAKICRTKWGQEQRHVTKAMKQQVFAAYGYAGDDDPRCVPDAHGNTCEIDHLISRELGGADDVKNLWPQA